MDVFVDTTSFKKMEKLGILGLWMPISMQSFHNEFYIKITKTNKFKQTEWLLLEKNYT